MTPHRDISPDLEKLLGDLPVHERRALRDAWILSGDAEEISQDVRASNWARLSSRLDRSSRRPLRLVRFPSRAFAVAASLLLFISLGYSLRPTSSVYLADAGENVEVALRDGSTVLLSPGTELRVGQKFGSTNRAVELEGEAFFDVASSQSNGGMTFTVATFNAEVVVVGTAFNVRARRSDVEGATRVAVEHGAVRVAAARQTAMDVLLTAGESSVVEHVALPTPAQAVDVERATAWRSNTLAFDDAPMGAVFDEVERLFDLEITATPDIRRMHVSYWREAGTGVDQILADLADVVDAQISRTANGYRVVRLDN